jgi:AbrB family looped-hinge helix DNA binding protein
MANVVGERFQITIDKAVREKLGVRPGDIAIERVRDGRLVVTFAPGPHQRSQLGILRQHARRPIEPITDWDAYRERTWSTRSSEIVDSLRDDSARRDDADG